MERGLKARFKTDFSYMYCPSSFKKVG